MIKTNLYILLEAIENHLTSTEIDDKEDDILIVTKSLKESEDGFYYLTKDDLKPLQISDESINNIMNEVVNFKGILEKDPFELFISFR